MQRQAFYSFSAGEQHASTDIMMRQNEIRTCRNGDFKKLGGVQKALGYKIFGATLPKTGSGKKVYSFTFNKEDGVTIYNIVAIDDGINVQIYASQNGGAWSAGLLSTPWTTGYKIRAVTFLNRFIITNGQNAPLSWDGTASFFDNTDLVGAPIGKYIKVFKTRLFFGNIYTYPQRIQYSTLPVTGAITWDSTFILDLPTEEGDYINGFDLNSGYLLVFKKYSLFKFDIQTDNTISAPALSYSVGCSAPDSIKTLGRYTIFMYENTLQMTNGAEPMYISEKETWLFDAINFNNIPLVFAETYKNTFYRLYIGSIIPTATNGQPDPINNAYIQYDVNTNAWSHGTCADNFVSYSKSLVNGFKYILAGTDSGQLMQLDTGYDQNGKAFEMKLEFQPFYGNSVDDFKAFDRVNVDGQRMKGINVVVEIDNTIITKVNQSIGFSYHDYIPIGRRYGHYCKVYLTDNSTKERPLIQSISVDYDPRAKDPRQSV